MGLLTAVAKHEFDDPVEPQKSAQRTSGPQRTSGTINHVTPAISRPGRVVPVSRQSSIPFEYSRQQKAIIECSAKIVVARAKAGTGKTTTGVGFALARPNERILYLAFARANADEAARRFPTYVKCRTTHAVARGHLSAKKNARVPRSWRAVTVKDDLGGNANYRIAAVVHRTLLSYFASRDSQLTEKHLLDAIDIFNPNQQEANIGLHYAQHLWADMCNEDGRSQIPHDAYLKMYALALERGNVRLNYDTVIFDEAQDANPVTAQIVEGLILNGSKALYLGDEHQSIYEFRGATNAMENLPAGAVVLPLQETHRFGEKVANIANTILFELKGETEKIIPLGKDGFWNTTDQYTLLSRSNAYLLTEAVGRDGKGIHWIGGIENYRVSSLKDTWLLKAGRRDEIVDPVIKKFYTFAEMELAGEDTNDREIIALVDLVKEHGNSTPALVDMLYANAVVLPEDAEMSMTTAHRGKGLEFDHVKLANDFECLEQIENTLANGDKLDSKQVQEINLLYVAYTRAKKTLYLDVLSREWLQNLPDYRRLRAIGQAKQQYQQAEGTNPTPTPIARPSPSH